MWLGSAFLAFYCLLLGECTAAALYLLHHKYYETDKSEMLRFHTLSIDALQAGNKRAFLAANTLAREYFGKSFFTGAALGLSALWPLPLALSWMSLRFEGIVLYEIFTGYSAGYVFVLATNYIIFRLCFGRLRTFLPLFRRVEALRQQRVSGAAAGRSPQNPNAAGPAE
jgi:hypothetical protein